MSPDGLYSFLARANAPEWSTDHVAGKRYELIVFVRESSEETAKIRFRRAIGDAGWTFPEIQEIAKIDGRMKLEKVERLGLDQAMRTAIKAGTAIVVFKNP